MSSYVRISNLVDGHIHMHARMHAYKHIHNYVVAVSFISSYVYTTNVYFIETTNYIPRYITYTLCKIISHFFGFGII